MTPHTRVQTVWGLTIFLFLGGSVAGLGAAILENDRREAACGGACGAARVLGCSFVLLRIHPRQDALVATCASETEPDGLKTVLVKEN